jgi:hypothetical protein
MKAFPETITAGTFATSWDGRLTTEAQLLVRRAQAFVQNGRNQTDLDDMRQAIRILIFFGRSLGWPRGLVLVIAGAIAGAIDRDVYGRFGRWIMRLFVAWLEFVARRGGMDGNAPGWNDYVLAYWMMTGNPEAVEELFARATTPVTDPALLPAKESAEWMVASVRRDCAEFDRAWREVEARERSAAAVEKALA